MKIDKGSFRPLSSSPRVVSPWDFFATESFRPPSGESFCTPTLSHFAHYLVSQFAHFSHIIFYCDVINLQFWLPSKKIFV